MIAEMIDLTIGGGEGGAEKEMKEKAEDRRGGGIVMMKSTAKGSGVPQAGEGQRESKVALITA